MKILYVIDIDGTIADNTHRIHFVKRPKGRRDWVSFHNPELVLADKVIEGAHKGLFHLLEQGETVRFLTGRNEAVREITKDWFRAHFGLQVPNYWLIMRSNSDYRPSPICKRDKIIELQKSYPEHFLVMLDDDPRNLTMFQEFGLALKAPECWESLWRPEQVDAQ